jgi:cysteine desulfurase
MTPIYLDHNATTPLAPEAAEAIARCQREAWANPASQHAAGRRARALLEDAREGIAALLGADLAGRTPDRLLFTSGGTEANNLALLGLAESARRSGKERAQPDDAPHAIISSIEHPSVIGPAEELARRGWRVDRAAVTADGVVDAAALIERIGPATRLVSLMLGNNETGALQPVQEIALAKSLRTGEGVIVHTDAVQVVGKLPVDFRDLGVDALSASGHKFHGPRGIGLLLLRHGVPIAPLHYGGAQQEGLRPGTEPVALAVGMHAALAAAVRDLAARAARMTALRDRFETTLAAELPGIVVHAGSAARLPHTSNIAFPGCDRQALLIALDLAGIACSTGSACASGSSEPSPALAAMGLPAGLLSSSLRFSLGAGTTAEEIDEAARRIVRICRDFQASQGGRKMPAGGRVSG